jgi:hypothetical protein
VIPVPYFFSLIRFVPDPARGEFVNLGALAGSDEMGEWDLRLVSNLARAKALDDRGVLTGAISYAAAFQDNIAALEQLEVRGVEPMSLDLLRLRSCDLQNVVQLTTPAPVAADSAESALDLIFEQLVLDVARKSFEFEKKHKALGAARRAYRNHGIGSSSVRERAPVRASAFDGTFDFAVHNGSAVQLVQCWSFQLPNQADLAEQVKSWSWVVHELRRSGGELSIGDSKVDVPSETEIFAIVVPPKEGASSPAFDEARAAFDEIGVRAVLSDDADEVGQRAAAALALAH